VALIGQVKRSALFELVLVVAMAIGLALAVQAWAVKPYRIPSGSMEPTLDIGERILVNRAIYHFQDPQPGDIVVFHPPSGATDGGADQCAVAPGPNKPCPKATSTPSDQTFIKRIVAGPGDTVAIRQGHPVVNGVEKRHEGYIRPCGAGADCNLTSPITIPPGEYYMLGDNRGESDDSRYWGPVPRDWIIGKAFLAYWPPDRIGPP
jgi:signal peptidase I